MYHHVPDFELDDIYCLPTSSGLTRKSAMAEQDITELLWRNGQLVTHNQRSGRRTSDRAEAVPPNPASETETAVVDEAPPQQQEAHLFMQEDEMASWLHYPLQETTFERDISQYFNPPPPPPPPQLEQDLKLSTSIVLKIQQESTSISRPPMPPSVKQNEVIIQPPPRRRVQNFAHFKKLPVAEPKESTVVDSNDTPKISQAGSSKAPEVECGAMNEGAGIDNSTTRDLTTPMNTYDFMTSSPGHSSASADPSANEAPKGEDRKTKGREADDNEGHSLDNEFEFGEEKKLVQGSTSTKRSRAAEVHNLSERRRRDRINERMKTLQELIPRCNKTDKASMLDEAIEYLKSLQMQVQMMSMGCGMVPIMYPGIQQYMPAMGMGIGMGMGMDLSMNRPLVPYPAMVQGSTMPNPQMAPRFPMAAFHMPVPITMDPSNPAAGFNPHPNFTDPYPQYLCPQQGQVLIPQQNQAPVQQNNAKPSTSREDAKPENQQPGD